MSAHFRTRLQCIDIQAGSDGGSVMTAQAFHTGRCGHASIRCVHMRVYRAAVTAARLLDGARSALGYQTRYAAVGCHHGLQVLQPTR